MISKIRQAVILAGGQGMRLRPLTDNLPKPMIPIQGKPFLEHIIKLLKKNGVKEIVILTGYLAEKIENYFKDGEKYGVKIKYSRGPIDHDTGTRIRNAKHLLDKEFLLLYGDNYWPLKLNELYEFYKSHNVLGLVTVYSNFDDSTKNNIRLDSKGLVELYDKTRTAQNLQGVDIGFFILQKKVLDLLPDENCSFEKIIMPALIQKKQLAGFLTYHKYHSLTDASRLPALEKYFQKKKVIFLDRDGVINKKAPKAEYITNWFEFVFLPKVIPALKLLTKKGYRIFIVSNQAGIARGAMTEKQLKELHGMLIYTLNESGIEIDDIFICSHGWDDGCFCRKPSPGLFFQAAAKHHINLFESYCIGDDTRDIIAGTAAGCKTIYLGKKKNLEKDLKKTTQAFRSLYEIARFL